MTYTSLEYQSETMVSELPYEKQSINPYVRLISSGYKITIPACKGGEASSIAFAKKTFSGYIDNYFRDFGINNIPQPATEEIDVEVYELYSTNEMSFTLFSSLSSDLNTIAFESQEQIEKFAEYHKE